MADEIKSSDLTVHFTVASVGTQFGLTEAQHALLPDVLRRWRSDVCDTVPIRESLMPFQLRKTAAKARVALRVVRFWSQSDGRRIIECIEKVKTNTRLPILQDNDDHDDVLYWYPIQTTNEGVTFRRWLLFDLPVSAETLDLEIKYEHLSKLQHELQTALANHEKHMEQTVAEYRQHLGGDEKTQPCTVMVHTHTHLLLEHVQLKHKIREVACDIENVLASATLLQHSRQHFRCYGCQQTTTLPFGLHYGETSAGKYEFLVTDQRPVEMRELRVVQQGVVLC